MLVVCRGSGSVGAAPALNLGNRILNGSAGERVPCSQWRLSIAPTLTRGIEGIVYCTIPTNPVCHCHRGVRPPVFWPVSSAIGGSAASPDRSSARSSSAVQQMQCGGASSMESVWVVLCCRPQNSTPLIRVMGFCSRL